MAAGDLSLLVTVPGGTFESGSILIDEDVATFEEGAHDPLSVGDLLALVTTAAVPALPPFASRVESPQVGARVESLRTGRYF